MVNKKLLQRLVCPQCKQKLSYHSRQRELRCARCRLAYPLRDGIPILLPGDARRTDA